MMGVVSVSLWKPEAENLSTLLIPGETFKMAFHVATFFEMVKLAPQSHNSQQSSGRQLALQTQFASGQWPTSWQPLSCRVRQRLDVKGGMVPGQVMRHASPELAVGQSGKARGLQASAFPHLLTHQLPIVALCFQTKDHLFFLTILKDNYY